MTVEWSPPRTMGASPSPRLPCARVYTLALSSICVAVVGSPAQAVTLQEKLDAQAEQRAKDSGVGVDAIMDVLVPQKRGHQWTIFGNDEHANNFSVRGLL